MLAGSINYLRPFIIAEIMANTPVMLHGDTGLGKSDFVRQIGASLQMNVSDKWRASTIEPVDIRGVPNVEDGFTKWNPPLDLPDEIRDGPAGIMFLDEINTGTQQVQAAMFQLVLERAIGNYKMPSQWRIAAAGNRVKDRAAAHKLTSPLANRFAHFLVEPEFASWKDWALSNDIAPWLIAFLEWKERQGDSILHKRPDTPDLNSFPTPRAWARVSKVMKASPEYSFQSAVANCGDAAGAELKGFLELASKLPKLEEVIKSPRTAPIPDNASAQYAVTAGLARAATAKNLQAIIEYLGRFDLVEFSIMGITDATRRDESLKEAPGYAQWAVKNQHVVL